MLSKKNTVLEDYYGRIRIYYYLVPLHFTFSFFKIDELRAF